jgi:uncharacterized protein (TIGR02466 family)
VSTALQSLFPTRILAAPLQRQADAAFNRQLLRECLQLREDDAAGRAWSKTNYLGGFTSYGSVSRMHQMSPTFARLAKRIDRHVARFAKALQFDLRDRQLEMTDCWVNIMPQGVVHSLHLHPLSTFSGTYYVQTPRGVPGLKFEDPRLDRYMAAPPRLPDADLINRPWVMMPATAGSLLLFESWLRHEVMPNPVARERISISFNYSWF